MDRVPLPLPRCSLTDDRTGLISREWYLFFLNLLTRTDSAQESLVVVESQQNSFGGSWGDLSDTSESWEVPGPPGPIGHVGPRGPAGASADLDLVLVFIADGNPVSDHFGNLMEKYNGLS